MNSAFTATDFKVFRENFDAGKTQLVWRWISSDLETPVSAYLKICGHKPYAFLLESVEGGATLGRYSIIGCKPDYFWRYEKQQDALQDLKNAIRHSTLDVVPTDVPPMCAFGLYGYMGYDMIRLIERVPDNLPDSIGIPDSILMRPTILAVFDNVKNMICIATPVYAHAKSVSYTAQHVFSEAQDRISNVLDTLRGSLPQNLLNNDTRLSVPLDVVSNTSENHYKNAVKQGIEYIKAGEIFQVVLSQRFEADFDLPSFELYRSLRSVNPSPFLFHIALEDFSLVGSSPEILVRVRDNTVTIRPIAGTRKRGATAAEDRALAEDLLADEKECAEHLMLLDLGRNDVGRVAEIGSVKVTDKFTIEYYSHVMHIVSNVQGTLRHDMDCVDALFAGFPAGTVSGAPKIRAMEIIDELEINRRMAYAGGIGYFSGETLDSCIALRTAIVKNGKIYIQAGAGVVADSNPDSEHQECINKSRAVIAAAEHAIVRHTSSNKGPSN